MKSFSSLVACMVCCSFSMSSVAVESPENLVGPYSGADLQSRHMHFRRGYSDNLVKDHYLQSNAYVGFRLHEWVGLEMGYQHAYQAASKTLFDGKDFFSVESPADYNTKVRTKIAGPHMNVVGFLPIPAAPCDLTLIGSVGLARLKLNIDGGVFVDASEFNPSSFIKRAWIPQASLGIQHMINTHFGIRGMLGWEKTSRFSNVPEFSKPHLSANLKNSTISSLGVFYKF